MVGSSVCVSGGEGRKLCLNNKKIKINENKKDCLLMVISAVLMYLNPDDDMIKSYWLKMLSKLMPTRLQ